MKKERPMIVRIIIYLVGITVIALGINISKMSGMGISPVSSIPGTLNAKFPNISLGGMVIIFYCILVLVQFIVLKKKFKPKNILGVPISVIFGILVDFLGNKEFNLNIGGIPLGINNLHGLLENFYAPQTILLRFVYLIASIIIIGIGVTVYLKANLVPMPVEGLAAAFSEITGKPFGNYKTAIDVTLITIAAIFQVIALGGFGTLLIGKGVVGIGTILSGICVGQVVKFINKAIKKFSKE